MRACPVLWGTSTMGNANPQVIQKSSIAGRPQGCPQAVTARPGAIQIRPYPQDRAYCSGWRVRDMDAPMDEHTTLRLHAIVLQMYRYATYEASQAPVDHSAPCRNNKAGLQQCGVACMQDTSPRIHVVLSATQYALNTRQRCWESCLAVVQHCCIERSVYCMHQSAVQIQVSSCTKAHSAQH